MTTRIMAQGMEEAREEESRGEGEAQVPHPEPPFVGKGQHLPPEVHQRNGSGSEEVFPRYQRPFREPEPPCKEISKKRSAQCSRGLHSKG